MKSSSSARGRAARVLGVMLVASLLSGLSPSLASVAQSAPAPTPPLATAQPPDLEAWRKDVARVPLPRKGCFTSSYPSAEWQEAPCTTAPAFPQPPARGPRPATVGNGADVSAEATTGHISEAVGSFDSVTGVTSEKGINPYTGSTEANIFSLQLNANFFATPTCNGASNPSNCQGWQQFVFDNAGGDAYIQYWLIDYNATCPSGWFTWETDCYTNSNAVSVPAQTIANLANLRVTGEAVSGGMDTFIMAAGSALYSVQNEDSVVHLAQGWQEAEFNVFGDGNGTEANFNSGSTIVVRTSVDYGSPNAPSCVAQGFTGETNNLSFGTAPAAHAEELPAAVFTESSAGRAASSCDSETSVGSAPSKLTLAATASATMQVGKAYSQTNVGSGGTTPYAYSVSAGALPAGTSLNASTGTVSGTPTAAGAFSYTIEVTGSGRPAQTATAASSGTIAPAATTTAIKSSVNPSAYGQAVTFTATVTSSGETPAGTVTFKDGTTTLGAGTLAYGLASFITSALTAGAHTITAGYGGDANFLASASSALTQTVNTATTATAIKSSVNPSAYEQVVTFTATVTSSGGTPTGTVTFKDGTTTLGAGTLASGVATFTTSALSAGAHTITAAYGGATDFARSTSPALTQTVNPPVYQGVAFVTAVNGGATNACVRNGIHVGDYYTMLYRSAAESNNAAYGGGIGFASERSSVALDLAAGQSLSAGPQVRTVTAVGQSSRVGPFTASSTFDLDIAPDPLLATTPGVSISGTVTNMWGFDGCTITLRASLTLRPQ